LRWADPPSNESYQMSKNGFISFRSQNSESKQAREPNLYLFINKIALMTETCTL